MENPSSVSNIYIYNIRGIRTKVQVKNPQKKPNRDSRYSKSFLDSIPKLPQLEGF